ncbi:MAG TPA: phenylalanine 4-monooxygenase [Flavobacteriales bacterium]|nr:phenylalanine 4-monooxygenase [Flavobacteriales bacterium]HRE76130.1 phenylalanine 4-monooxygenase [Flavobacteriales bacterium]HRE95948.1 phenylalanine 4-monooxygenase [Flavobacteriales bacterium]HRJ38179.1 phenylalanine 4-monooxygenase [Flavobacteriales bacterium]
MKQNYSNYNKEDQEVWSILFSRQIAQLEEHACTDFRLGLHRLRSELNADAIPDFDRLNTLLYKLSGWSIEVVPGLISVNDFFMLLSQRKFPSSTWLRKKDQIHYLEEPDMFHDVFGHIPMLALKEYADFMEQFGKAGMNNPEQVTSLQRLYWFTVEFGLVQEDGRQKIFGAGLASSFGESSEALHCDKGDLRPFSLETIMATGFFTDRHQDFYFVLKEAQQLFDAFAEYRITLPCLT